MIERGSEQLSPREWATYNNEKEMWTLQAEHQAHMKDKDIEVQKLEARWSAWFKIPLMIIKLPVLILFVIPMTVYAVTHQEVPEFYKQFFRF